MVGRLALYGRLNGEIYSRVKNELKRAGYKMPDNDIWIAATAMQYDVILAARDAHFNWISGLRRRAMVITHSLMINALELLRNAA